MSIFRKCLVLLATIIACQATTLRAASVVLEPVPAGSGTIEHYYSVSSPFFTTTNTYTSRKPLISLPAAYSFSGGTIVQSQTVGYMVFDISAVPFAVEQASIQLELSPSEIGNVRFRSIEVLSLDYLVLLQHNENLGVTVGTEVMSALSGGTLVGTGANPASGLVTIRLDTNAVQGINNANGLWGLAVIFEFTDTWPLNSLDLINPPKLVLSDQPPLPPGC